MSRDIDVASRTLLVTRGGRKGNLSRFVEKAINREMLRETVRDLHTQNDGIDDAEIDNLIDTEMRTTHADFRTQLRG